jgi:hypothetical protein
VTPYKPGDRVVCLRPPAFVGVIVYIGGNGEILIRGGSVHAEVGPDDVCPAMPRDRGDLERWGRWWWLNNKPVWITPGVRLAWTHSPGWPHGNAVTPDGDWRGPVARPPEVRS